MSAAFAEAKSEPAPPPDPVLSVVNLEKHFPIREGALQRVAGHVRAVDGVSFEIRRGETLGLVGESGCGKTTLGRCVAGLSDITGGAVYFGLSRTRRDRLHDLLAIPPAERSEAVARELAAIEDAHRIDRLRGETARHFRRNCQFVFQDAFTSLNPRHLVRDLVGRPLSVYREASGADLTERVVELLEQVGLGRQHLYRYPHQFSGGQRQRISIARALALNPELIVLDEPTSSLDVSVQAQILNLLQDLQQERKLAYLFITHNLSVVRHMSDRIVVMYLGKVAEAGDTTTMFERPHHPYTRALLAAIPSLADDLDVKMPTLEGTIPDPARPPQGCRFHTRCPEVTPICGWEVDDVVRWLENRPGMFDSLSGVSRSSAFDATLTFDESGAAGRLAAALRSDAVPAAMQAALEEVAAGESDVRIRFRPVDEVLLKPLGPEHASRCVLPEPSFNPRREADSLAGPKPADTTIQSARR